MVTVAARQKLSSRTPSVFTFFNYLSLSPPLPLLLCTSVMQNGRYPEKGNEGGATTEKIYLYIYRYINSMKSKDGVWTGEHHCGACVGFYFGCIDSEWAVPSSLPSLRVWETEREKESMLCVFVFVFVLREINFAWKVVALRHLSHDPMTISCDHPSWIIITIYVRKIRL